MGIQAAIQRKLGEFIQPFLDPDSTKTDAIESEHLAKNPWAGMSRRELLFGGGIAATALGASGCPVSADPALLQEESDLEPGEKGLDPLLRRLVERCTYGANKEELALAKQLGYDEYLEYHLDYTNIDDSEMDQRLSEFVSLNYSPKDFANASEAGNYDVFYELINATILRSAYSKRQLYQRMVEFWTDHFNIYIEKDYQYYLKPVDDREVVRKHALGTFPDLLWASAHSPAMLVYLDNDPSSKEAPNQNYARELMELHTLGVGNYTQTDVEEVAKCFTGWSVVYDYEQPNWGDFKFYGWAHDRGKKNVLGHELPKKGGVRDGEIVLDILANDPTVSVFTARFIGKKLANWLWGYNPPVALIDSLAATYASTAGDIKAMIRVALSPEWLAQAPLKLKRPYHYVMSSLRMVPSDITEFWGIRYALSLMGHEPFQWAPPNGYPDALQFWAGLLLPRWTYGALIYNQDYNPIIDLSQFEGEMNTGVFMKKLNKTFFGGTMSANEKTLIYDYIDPNIDSEWRRKETLGLAISCSGFQWY